MEELLDLDQPPLYLESSYRAFLPGERHVDRRVDFDVLLIMLEGTLLFFEAGRRRAVAAGEWYLQRAGRLQEGREPSAQPRYFYVHFRGAFSKAPKNPLPLGGRFSPTALCGVLGQLDLAEKSGRSLTERNRWFYELLSSLSAGAGENTLAGELEAYIAAHYMEPLRIGDLAERFSYSPDHLIRLFKRLFSQTPHQYIRRLRLTQAQKMLATTGRSIPAVAARTGFGDASTLFRAFVRETGLTPSAWRERARHGADGPC